MGLLDRVGTLIRANLNDLVDKAEDPEKMLDQLLLDMNNDLAQVKTQVAGSIADERILHQKYEEASSKAAGWQRKAGLAVDKGADDLAKTALSRKNSYQETADGFYQQWQSQDAQVEEMKGALHQLEQKISEAESKKDLLVARHRRAKTETKIRETLAGIGKSSALAEFERLEDKVEHEEARADAALEMETDTTEAKFAALEAGSEESQIDQELAQLKAQRAQKALPG